MIRLHIFGILAFGFLWSMMGASIGGGLSWQYFFTSGLATVFMFDLCILWRFL